MKDEAENAIKKLIQQAEQASDSNDALKWSQAATNVANAYASFQHASKVT